MVTFLCNGEKWDHIGPLRDLALEYGYRYVITDSVEDLGRILPDTVKSGKTKAICILGGDGTIYRARHIRHNDGQIRIGSAGGRHVCDA